MRSFRASTASYESKLKSFLGDDIVAEDLRAKHRKMRKNAFTFLRATCWRWAERATEVCPDLADATAVLSPGDVHVENFGLWRDTEGRLVWGIEDFDEAAVIPYAFDLVRLGASVLLADKADGAGPRAIAQALLRGYRAALEEPRPFILEYENLWLRDLFAATESARVEYWTELSDLAKAMPRRRYVTALTAAFPEGAESVRYLKRRAGVGSLGRPRFVALGHWRGGPFAREAKALIPSCWMLDSPLDRSGRSLLRSARGRFRAPDPWLDVRDGVVVRRLGPNSRKLEIDQIGRLRKPVLEAMGLELANIHSDDAAIARRIAADLAMRKSNWLERAIAEVADATIRDWKAFRRT